jgi:hypothetical protein
MALIRGAFVVIFLTNRNVTAVLMTNSDATPERVQNTPDEEKETV